MLVSGVRGAAWPRGAAASQSQVHAGPAGQLLPTPRQHIPLFGAVGGFLLLFRPSF